MHYIVQDFLTPLSKYYLYIHKHLQCNIQPTSIIFFQCIHIHKRKILAKIELK